MHGIVMLVLTIGSPPHTWRIQCCSNLRLVKDRITSTYVENTFSYFACKLHIKDHLHIRGEYAFLQVGYGTGTGSPPHTWRIPKVKKLLKELNRITSTYVENTIKILDSYVCH